MLKQLTCYDNQSVIVTWVRVVTIRRYSTYNVCYEIVLNKYGCSTRYNNQSVTSLPGTSSYHSTAHTIITPSPHDYYTQPTPLLHPACHLVAWHE